MSLGSLFSGIGGLELGLEAAGWGPTLYQAEKDEYCRRVLRRHFPEAKRLHDTREIQTADAVPYVDVLCGGFPCQDVSSAGRRAGLGGRRSGEWREFARVAELVAPRWIVVENVASGAALWVDSVVRELVGLGWEALPLPLSAADVGSPQRRERVFVVARRVADADGVQEREQQQRGSQRRPRQVRKGRAPQPGHPGRQLGDAAGEGRQQQGVRGAARDAQSAGTGRAVEHTDRVRRQGIAAPGLHAARKQGIDADGSTRSLLHDWPPRRDDADGWASYLADGGPQPGIRRGSAGLSEGLEHRRREQLRCLGNAAVPQCAEVVGHVMRVLDDELAGALSC